MVNGAWSSDYNRSRRKLAFSKHGVAMLILLAFRLSQLPLDLSEDIDVLLRIVM